MRRRDFEGGDNSRCGEISRKYDSCVCQSLSTLKTCTLLQKEAKQGVKETIQDSPVQTDGPPKNLPDILKEKLELKDAELEAALLKEREHQQLEEANEREKEETRKQIVKEKEAEVTGYQL